MSFSLLPPNMSSLLPQVTDRKALYKLYCGFNVEMQIAIIHELYISNRCEDIYEIFHEGVETVPSDYVDFYSKASVLANFNWKDPLHGVFKIFAKATNGIPFEEDMEESLEYEYLRSIDRVSDQIVGEKIKILN